jgi:serine/threonine-protein kinase
VLTQEEVRAALSTATPRAAGTATGGAPAPAQPGKLIRSAGGTVIASCAGDQVTLRSWSPAQNYSVDGVEPGPAPEATVEFEPHEGEDVELTIACTGGQPVARTQ